MFSDDRTSRKPAILAQWLMTERHERKERDREMKSEERWVIKGCREGQRAGEPESQRAREPESQRAREPAAST